VAKNEKEGVIWIQKSAEQGHMKAQYALAQLYRDGRGVEKDIAIAYALFDVAGRDGHQAALKERDALMATAKAEQIAQGKLIASQWEKAMPIKVSNKGNFK
jgi:TPR repeat protein